MTMLKTTWSVVTALGLIGLLPSAHAEDELWLDARVRPLPTDKLGPFVRTTSGELLAIDSTASFVSADEGKTWSTRRPLFSEQQNIKVSNERAMFRTRTGVIIAAFMNLAERHWTWSDELGDAPGARLPTYVMRSLDDGKTWQDIQKLHEDWSGAVRDMIQTKDGRVIFTAMKMQHAPGRHAVLTYSSTDDGKTWKASNLIDAGGAGHHGGVTEPTLTELPDGRVWMLIRTNWGEFWSAYSSDGGRFWRVIQPSGIPASSAPGLLKRLSSGRLLLVWNRPFPDGKTEWPLSGGDNRWSGTPVSNHREELSVAFSDDDGKTWTAAAVIAHRHDTPARDSARWVAYPYVFEISPGKLWITTMQGGLRVQIRESDFVTD
jgi:sialidase-1